MWLSCTKNKENYKVAALLHYCKLRKQKQKHRCLHCTQLNKINVISIEIRHNITMFQKTEIYVSSLNQMSLLSPWQF